MLSLAGCWKGPPGRVYPQAVAPDAAKGPALYDANHDGFLDAKELENVPGLKAALKHSTAGATARSAPPTFPRLEAWKSGTCGRLAVFCGVKHNGKPLPGAVIFEPESFLGGELAAGKGTTYRLGTARISCGMTAKDPPGLSPGFFRVRITKSGEPIPARYNSRSTLAEVAEDVEEIGGSGFLFDLQY